MGNRRLPPAVPGGGRGMISGPTVSSFSVGSWCEPGQADLPPTCVGIVITPEWEHGDFVLRLKTPAQVDTLIEGLLRHKREVWPEAP